MIECLQLALVVAVAAGLDGIGFLWKAWMGDGGTSAASGGNERRRPVSALFCFLQRRCTVLRFVCMIQNPLSLRTGSVS